MSLAKQDRKTQLEREQRRKEVAQLVQLRLTEAEIAQRLNVNPATVSRDIKTLKQTAIRFVYDLAKQDLAFFYKDLIDDINKARMQAWGEFYKCTDERQRRDRLNALKVVVQSNTAMFELLQQGPAVMSVKAMEERLTILEQGLGAQAEAEADENQAEDNHQDQAERT